MGTGHTGLFGNELLADTLAKSGAALPSVWISNLHVSTGTIIVRNVLTFWKLTFYFFALGAVHKRRPQSEGVPIPSNNSSKGHVRAAL